MTKRFNPHMLLLARESRDMTQSDLSERSGITQGYISKVEHGDKEIADDKVPALARALSYPESFFYQPGQYTGLGLTVVFYRKRASASVAHLRRLQAEVAIRRFHLATLLRGVDLGPTPRAFHRMDIDEHDGKAAYIAQLIRASWSLPLGPVSNLVAAIESAGGVVFKFSFGTKDIDALSQWPDHLPPLFFINSDAPADRVRFSLCHELGHVVMHTAASDTMESEADRFASEFLMPEREITPHLVNLNLERAAQLKPYWRVSMAALVRRARDVGSITDDGYAMLFRRLSYLGLRKNEGLPITPEEPRLFDHILKTYMASNAYGAADMARMLSVFEDEFCIRYIPRPAGPRLAV